MEVRTRKLENDLTLRIPRDFASELGLGPDSPVDVSILGASIIICPTRFARVSLEDLLAGVTEDNQHREIETGPAVGREVW